MGKHLKQQHQKGKPAMAGLLLMVVGCIPLTGCLFPQDQQVPGELPPKRNGAVKIVSQLPALERITFRNSFACAAQNPAFLVIVSDEDVTDTMRSRWLVGDQIFEGRNVTVSTSAQRTVNAPTDSTFRTKLAGLTAGRTELLTVFVSDTEVRVVDGKITLEERPAHILPDGTAVADLGSSDSFTFVLDVEPCL